VARALRRLTTTINAVTAASSKICAAEEVRVAPTFLSVRL